MYSAQVTKNMYIESLRENSGLSTTDFTHKNHDGGFDQAIQVWLSKLKYQIVPPWGSGFSNNKVSRQSKPILESFYASIPEYSTLPSDST